ncbi:MAG: septum formation initiator family protein [Patescibacteria group bacterium]|jgi:cell division protein FtsL
MIKKENKNFISKILYSQKFLALVGLVLIVLISFPLARSISKRYQIDKEISDLDKEIAEVETKNKDLKQLINYLESDQFVEEKARLNLGLKKEGESVVVIKEDLLVASGSPSGGDKSGASENFSNFQKWWNYFFNNSL